MSCFILSTCNRTELYGIADNAQQLIDLLCSVAVGDTATFIKGGYVENGQRAIQHLFYVCAGLDRVLRCSYGTSGFGGHVQPVSIR